MAETTLFVKTHKTLARFSPRRVFLILMMMKKMMMMMMMTMMMMMMMNTWPSDAMRSIEKCWSPKLLASQQMSSWHKPLAPAQSWGTIRASGPSSDHASHSQGMSQWHTMVMTVHADRGAASLRPKVGTRNASRMAFTSASPGASSKAWCRVIIQ